MKRVFIGDGDFISLHQLGDNIYGGAIVAAKFDTCGAPSYGMLTRDGKIWTFAMIGEINQWSRGRSSYEEAIKSVIEDDCRENEVYMFDNITEFAEWLIKERL